MSIGQDYLNRRDSLSRRRVALSFSLSLLLFLYVQLVKDVVGHIIVALDEIALLNMLNKARKVVRKKLIVPLPFGIAPAVGLETAGRPGTPHQLVEFAPGRLLSRGLFRIELPTRRAVSR